MTDLTRSKEIDRNKTKARPTYLSSETSDVSDTDDKSGDGDKSSRNNSDFRLEFRSKKGNERGSGNSVFPPNKSESKDRLSEVPEEKDSNNNLGASISNSSLFGDGEDAPCGAGRSIEIFFGDFTNFGNFYQALSYTDENNSSNIRKEQAPTISDSLRDSHHGGMKNVKNSVNPVLVKKLCLVGHPLESFRGINNFKRLLEAWVTNCTIRELRTRDLDGLQFLQRLYAFGCSLEKVDPLRLDNLRILWLSGNRLTSLTFLNHGLPCLQELNVASNEISCLSVESLFKCVNLLNLNVAGNPLCTIQDIQAVNACPALRELSIIDPMYGKCPVACLCDSRTIIISSIKNISVLNGKKITADEINITKEYIRQRCLYYYSNSVAAKSSHVALRNATIASVYKQLENIGDRIMELLTFMAQTEYQLSTIPVFSKSKALVKDEMQKVHRRIADLRMWAVVTIERFETVIHINRWEQEVEEWIKWAEYQSYGSIQAYVAHSVLDLASSKDVENIRATIHQLISGLSCSKPWPEETVLKVETIAVIRDKGAESGLEKTYGIYFSRSNEPRFIPPPPETPPPPPDPSLPVNQQYPPFRFVPTYTDPDYRYPDPLFPFPESVPGLPERSHPCFMFLVCDNEMETNPVHYLYKLLTDKSENYKDIRFTNCLWNAIEAVKFSDPQKSNSKPANETPSNKGRSCGATRVPRTNDVGASPFSVVVVMKVLEECLVTVPMANEKCKKHSFDCLTFGVSRPLSYAPAYILSISHSYNDKDAIWVRGVTDDSEVKTGVESLYRDAVTKQLTNGFVSSKAINRKVQPYYLHKCGHGMKADLTAITKLVQNPVPLRGDTMEKELVTHQLETLAKLKANVDLLRISKFLGQEIAHTVTTLDLSGNRLGLTVGLEGMNNLRRLNLSHNNLTTLSGLHKLPHLIELKASWNYLRFLHSNISTLTWATPRLTTLEILPNPFQDVRDYAHIPLLVSQALPSLHRVDIWSAPFATAPNMAYNCFLSSSHVDIESGFSHAIMANSWALGRSLIFKEFRSKCLTNLDQLPRSPPFPDGFSINAIELDLSDNYLSSTALGVANFIRTSEWRAAIIKLNLQENCITNLDWLKDNIFPNLHILNLSNNHLQDLDMIQFACPALIHLHLSGNPLPCNTFILAPLRHLPHLQTLEAKRTPLSSHPDYGSYVMRYIQNIQVLDGVPVANWRSEEIINHMGGTLNGEWLELNLGQRDWSALTELSLPHCGLSRVNLPPTSVPKLMSLDLTGNQLSTFSGVTSLPNLRVLCVSYNSIKSLGETPCPTCYSHTAESRALFQKNKFGGLLGPSSISSSTSGSGSRMDSKSKFNAQSMRKSFVSKVEPGKFQSLGTFRGSDKESPPPYSPRGANGAKIDAPKIFPRLEVLILSHNSLSGVSDLHLHCLPRLQTLLLNCNQITSFKGLDKLTSVQAIVLDHNQIKDIPFNSFAGCKSLKYLHMEHNRIACLPRLPHLNNLAALHLGYNRIQSLTDVHCLLTIGVKELTLVGNPAAYRTDYCKDVVNKLGTLQKLDGTDITAQILNLRGDFPALKFTINETTKKPDQKSSTIVPAVPHGKLQYRPTTEYRKEDVDDQFTDVTE